jgi:DNA repair photolyase
MRAEYREEPCRTALSRVSGMGFRWSLNPYTGCVHRCAFCYVRGFERRADRPADERYGTSIRVKVNIVEVLRAELRRRGWRRETVAIGAATDPYQPAEGRYRLTRGCLEALAEARTPVSLITRGPLVVRDVDVLAHAARRAAVTVSVSVATLDETLAAHLEPGVAPPRQRLRAVRALTDAGIVAGVALAPVLPGLTDAPRDMAAVLAARPRGRRGPRLVQRAQPARGDTRAFPRGARAGVAGGAGTLSAAVPRRGQRLPGAGRRRSDHSTGRRRHPGRRDPGPASHPPDARPRAAAAATHDVNQAAAGWLAASAARSASSVMIARVKTSVRLTRPARMKTGWSPSTDATAPPASAPTGCVPHANRR